MKTLLRRLAIDLGGAFLVGLIIDLFVPAIIGVLVGVAVFAYMAWPSWKEYRREISEAQSHPQSESARSSG